MQGRVAVYWQHKHFGFIVEGNSSSEIFFHQNNLVPGSPVPEKGSRVTYEIGDFNGRRVADNVRVVPATPGGAA